MFQVSKFIVTQEIATFSRIILYFSNVKNGVPVYFAIGGLSCYKPHVSRIVVIEKRPDHADRTVFVEDDYNYLYTETLNDYWDVVYDECVDDKSKKFSPIFNKADVALVRLPIPLDIPAIWTPDTLKVNTICWNTVNSFTYDHLTPIYVAGFGFKDPPRFPSLNWIRREIIAKDEYPNPIDRTLKFLSDDNIDQLGRSVVLMTSMDTNNGSWALKAARGVSLQMRIRSIEC